MRIWGIAALAGALAGAAWAQGKEQAVGLILAPGGGVVLRAGNELALGARAGEVLFPGDTVRSAGAPLTFLYCPEKVSVTLDASSEALLEPRQLKMRGGRLAGRAPANSCLLPETVRVSAASQQHYGGSLVRALRPGAAPEANLASRMAALPEEKRRALAAALAPIDQLLAGNPADLRARTARAVLLEEVGLALDAIADYRALAREWPEAAWVRGKVFELEQRAALADTAPQDAGGRTLALLVGVSRYQKLPESLWLRYAHADAALFARHLKSPRGGALPESDVVELADEKATTAAVRNAFATFLEGRAGRNDTVLLFIAAHGTVESGRGAYILTWDSDPQDLAATALPMADIQKLVREQLAHVGRVLVFVDMCRAGTIGAIRSTTVNSSVERLAEAEGEILGLMGSRPKELSIEGPEFGGGHGAFSYFLLKALDGAGGRNHDGKVDVNEVIAFVRDRVAEATGDRQHPRDFGSLGNAVALSDTTRPGLDIAHWPAWPQLWAALGGPAAEPGAHARAFRDAARRAPYWAYPRHNLALARAEAGDYEGAIREYREAMRLAPRYAYLPYNLGLLYQRLNRRKEAASAYYRAIELAPDSGEAWNALGSLEASAGHGAEAERLYRRALEKNAGLLAARHNLALLLAAKPDRGAEAVRLWEQNLESAPDYVPSRLSLAEALARMGRQADAAGHYRKLLAAKPDYVAARLALADVLAASGKPIEAAAELREALKRQPENALLHERLGDCLRRSGDTAGARDAYESARTRATEGKDRKRIRTKLAQL